MMSIDFIHGMIMNDQYRWFRKFVKAKNPFLEVLERTKTRHRRIFVAKKKPWAPPKTRWDALGWGRSHWTFSGRKHAFENFILW